MNAWGSRGRLRELVQVARRAAAHSYSPYSRVRVGAALVARDGRVFTGCNVENASFGLTQCAERAALTAAVGAGAREHELVVVWSSLARPLPPCGACRQALREFSPSMKVVSAGRAGGQRSYALAALLPDAMGPDDLRRTRRPRRARRAGSNGR